MNSEVSVESFTGQVRPEAVASSDIVGKSLPAQRKNYTCKLKLIVIMITY